LINVTPGVFGCARSVCIYCGKRVDDETHHMRYVGRNTLLIRCRDGVGKVRK